MCNFSLLATEAKISPNISREITALQSLFILILSKQMLFKSFVYFIFFSIGENGPLAIDFWTILSKFTPFKIKKEENKRY